MSTPSPIDEFEAPEQLTARVVQAGPRPRLHGYDVQDDLARHFDFGELVLTALTGEAPEAAHGRAFGRLLCFLAPVGVGEAPVHGAVIARLCASPSRRVTAAAAVGLCEQGGAALEEQSSLLRWLDEGSQGHPPPEHQTRQPEPRAAVARLHARLREAGLTMPPSHASLSLPAAITAGLHACGLTTPWQLETAWCLARLPVAAAEAMAASPGALRSYPIRLPAFRHGGDRHEQG